MTIKNHTDYVEEILPKYRLRAFKEIIEYCKRIWLIDEIYTPPAPEYEGRSPIVIVKFANNENLYKIPLEKLVHNDKQKEIIKDLDYFIPLEPFSYTSLDYTKCGNLTKLDKSKDI